MEKEKIKVALVCHFSNEEIRSQLHLRDLRGINFIRRILGKNEKSYYDFAPWINNILYQCHSFPELDVHVIAPHQGMITRNVEFDKDGITYHFYQSKPSDLFVYGDDVFFGGKHITYQSNRRFVERVIKTIFPDIIVLVGTENPYYSGTVLNIENIPLLVLCQTVYNNPEFEEGYRRAVYTRRSEIERQLFNKTCYFGVYNEKHKKLLRENGYQGYIFEFNWPSGAPSKPPSAIEKKYDFVNFANGMSWNKGYHDCVIALSIVKNTHPSVKLALIDKGPFSVKKELLELINKYNLKDNVTFIPFFEKKSDLYQFLMSVRFAVLPCKVDHVSGTMHQAMGRGLPTVVYETTGTPLLNKKNHCVLIAKMNDVDDLAKNMLALMDNEQLALELSNNSVNYMKEYRKNNENRMEQLIREIRAVIDNYYSGKPIPSDLIYSE